MFVTGYSCRAPASNNPKEFFENLVEKIDMVTPTRRYPEGYHGLPPRTGTLPDIASFDHEFFKVNRKQTDKMEPLVRLLLAAERHRDDPLRVGSWPEVSRDERTLRCVDHAGGLDEADAAVCGGSAQWLTSYQHTRTRFRVSFTTKQTGFAMRSLDFFRSAKQ